MTTSNLPLGSEPGQAFWGESGIETAPTRRAFDEGLAIHAALASLDVLAEYYPAVARSCQAMVEAATDEKGATSD